MDGSNLLAHGYFFAFVTVFVGGFLTSLTPCVYPLIRYGVAVRRAATTCRARAP
jgi:cytochrome c biogenesis protein CcdA